MSTTATVSFWQPYASFPREAEQYETLIDPLVPLYKNDHCPLCHIKTNVKHDSPTMSRVFSLLRFCSSDHRSCSSSDLQLPVFCFRTLLDQPNLQGLLLRLFSVAAATGTTLSSLLLNGGFDHEAFRIHVLRTLKNRS